MNLIYNGELLRFTYFDGKNWLKAQKNVEDYDYL